MTSGIYAIRHEASDRVYVGQSQDIEKRWNNHRTTLNRNCHHNKYLQRCWNKYGSDAFVFEILVEEDDLTKLSSIERLLMFSVDKKQRMNLAEDTEASFRGRHHTEENKRIFSENARSHRHSVETKKKMSEAQKRRYSTVEGRRARSEAAKAHYARPGTREAHGRSQKKWANTPEARRKNSEAQNLSYKQNPQRHENLRQAQQRRWGSEEERIRHSRGRGGRPVVGTNLETGEEWRYEYLEAIKRDGFQPGSAKRVISGQYRQHGGHTWRYVEIEEEL